MINLTALARAQGKRRSLTLRPIIPTAMQANQLAAILAPSWQFWRDAMDSIMAGYDPAPLATVSDSATVQVLDSPAQIETAINAAAAEFLTRLLVQITPGLRRFAVSIERWHRGKWTANVKAATDVDLGTILLASEAQESIQTFIARNVALVKNVSEQAQGRISDAVFRGYQERRPAREVAKEIREAVDMGRARSIRIASHQTSNLASALDDERMAEAGLEKWKYRHSGKLHPRSTHLVRDGRIYYLKTNKQVGGDDVIAAGDGPGQPPGCGCRKQGYIDLQAELD